MESKAIPASNLKLKLKLTEAELGNKAISVQLGWDLTELGNKILNVALFTVNMPKYVF